MSSINSAWYRWRWSHSECVPRHWRAAFVLPWGCPWCEWNVGLCKAAVTIRLYCLCMMTSKSSLPFLLKLSKFVTTDDASNLKHSLEEHNWVLGPLNLCDSHHLRCLEWQELRVKAFQMSQVVLVEYGSGKGGLANAVLRRPCSPPNCLLMSTVGVSEERDWCESKLKKTCIQYTHEENRTCTAYKLL